MNVCTIVWLLLAVAFIVVELSTSSLVSIWFAPGALLALVASVFDVHIIIQLLIFALTSALFLALMMPFSKKLLKNKKHATNSDRIIGKDAVVTEDIDTLGGKGQISVLGSIWSAKTADGKPLSKGCAVTVLNIEGVKAVVKERE